HEAADRFGDPRAASGVERLFLLVDEVALRELAAAAAIFDAAIDTGARLLERRAAAIGEAGDVVVAIVERDLALDARAVLAVAVADLHVGGLAEHAAVARDVDARGAVLRR